MKLSIQGELPVFNKLIEAVRKEIDGIDPSGEMQVTLADDANHGNSLVFARQELGRFVRVRFALWDKDRFAFLLLVGPGYGVPSNDERCIFQATELDRGTRATATLIRHRLLGLSDDLFDQFFQKAKQ